MSDRSDAPPLRAIATLLERAEIPFMVVGSFASVRHGTPRSTQDLDIVIDPTVAALDSLLASVDPEQFYVDADVARDALRNRSMFNVIDMNSAWKIDLIVRKARAFSREEFARRTTTEILDLRVPVATAEDTIISKLEWNKLGGSDRQLDDVAGVIRVTGEELDRAYVERWVDDLDLRTQWNRALELAH